MRVKHSLRLLAVAALATAGLMATAATAGQAETGNPTSFGYVGDNVEQEYVVPDGVAQLQIEVNGAAGGAGGLCDVDPPGACGTPSPGGKGARIVVTIDVKAGDVVTVVIGGAGADGTDSESFGDATGGGGGGASVIFVNGELRYLAAGGGGAGANGDDIESGVNPGGAGGDSGTDGSDGDPFCNGDGGKAATLAGGGAGGLGGDGVASGDDGGDGSLAQGGSGGAGGFDDNNEGLAGNGGGGGGGGLYGGGGGGGGGADSEGCTGAGGGGGGGASYVADGTLTDGANAGDGSATITPIYSAIEPTFTG